MVPPVMLAQLVHAECDRIMYSCIYMVEVKVMQHSISSACAYCAGLCVIFSFLLQLLLTQRLA